MSSRTAEVITLKHYNLASYNGDAASDHDLTLSALFGLLLSPYPIIIIDRRWCVHDCRIYSHGLAT